MRPPTARARTGVTGRPRDPRIAGIDGLRSLAVAAVLLSHGWGSAFPGGGAGVDVFFVISGYVITVLLLDEHQRDGKVHIPAFLGRRALRLAPALVIAVAGTVGLSALVGDGRQELGRAANALTWTMDLYRASRPLGDYGQGLLLHTWSLSVEEQFYVVWPVVLVLVVARGSVALLARVAAAGAVLAALEGLLLLLLDPTAVNHVYNGPDTRSQQLLAGCVLACVLRTASAHVRALLVRACRLLAWPAAGALVVWVLRLGPGDAVNEGGFRVALSLTAVTPLALALVALVVLVPRRHPLSRALGWAPLATFGRRYSYGVYLWHFPLVLLLPRGGVTEPALVVAVGGVCSFALAHVSLVLVEQPLWRSVLAPAASGVT